VQVVVLALHVALVGLLAWLAWVDVRERRLPNQLVLAVAGVGVVHVLAQATATRSLDSLLSAVLGAVLSAVLPLAVALLTARRASGPAFGMGDVKLLAALGIFTGPAGFFLLPIASTLAAIVLLPQLLFRLAQKQTRKITIAFGPYILLATVTLFVFSP